MNVILNNIIALLSEGAFQKESDIAPMSEFKWHVLLSISQIEDVSPYIYKGVLRHNDDQNMNIPSDVKDELAKANFSNIDRIQTSFDLNSHNSAGLSYPVKRYVFKDIIYKERHSIDTSTTSLDLLAVILQNSDNILRYGIRLRGIIELGIFLRTKGQHVDFLKIETWLQKLKLTKMATLQAGILVSTFSFDEDEFPFVRKFDKSAPQLIARSLNRVYKAHKLDRSFSKYNISNCIRFRKYSRSEAFCKATSNIAKSLSEIEE